MGNIFCCHDRKEEQKIVEPQPRLETNETETNHDDEFIVIDSYMGSYGTQYTIL